jgi:hypothetical protein
MEQEQITRQNANNHTILEAFHNVLATSTLDNIDRNSGSHHVQSFPALSGWIHINICHFLYHSTHHLVYCHLCAYNSLIWSPILLHLAGVLASILLLP